jgi:hypothetical protein
MAKISISQAPAWVSMMGKEIKAAAVKGLYSAAVRTVSHIQTVVIPREPRVPVDRGIYRAGWRAEKLPDGAMVINTVPYASIIELGARAGNIKPGRKMIDALTEWVRRKGLAKKGGTLEARQIAWAIARHMQKHGIFNEGKGLRILEKAVVQIPQFIDEEIRREIQKI